MSEIKEQSFSVKKVIACAGLIVSCLSTDGNTNTQRGKRKKNEFLVRVKLRGRSSKKMKRISIIFVLSYFPDAAGRISFDSFTRIKSLGFSLVSGAGGVL